MIYTSCTLRKLTINYNDFGAKIDDSIVETEVPIIRIEKVRQTEFYKASEVGFKPELRLVISTLNYNDEEELKYGEVIYSIIRKEIGIDTMILICERKIKNA